MDVSSKCFAFKCSMLTCPGMGYYYLSIDDSGNIGMKYDDNFELVGNAADVIFVNDYLGVVNMLFAGGLKRFRLVNHNENYPALSEIISFWNGKTSDKMLGAIIANGDSEIFRHSNGIVIVSAYGDIIDVDVAGYVKLLGTVYEITSVNRDYENLFLCFNGVNEVEFVFSVVVLDEFLEFVGLDQRFAAN